MSTATPLPCAGRRPRSKESIRRHQCRLTDADGEMPPLPSSMPPSLPTSPPPLTPSSSSSNHSFLTPNFKESAKFSSASAVFRSKVLSSTPYPPNRVVRKSTPIRKTPAFPLLIPTELTLSIVRESPPTAAEELTCGDHVDDGKEDSVSSTRPAEESAAITERQCVAYGTPRETSVAAAAAAAAHSAAVAATAGVTTTVEEISESTEHTMGACTSKKSSSGSVKKSEKSPPTTK